MLIHVYWVCISTYIYMYFLEGERERERERESERSASQRLPVGSRGLRRLLLLHHLQPGERLPGPEIKDPPSMPNTLQLLYIVLNTRPHIDMEEMRTRLDKCWVCQAGLQPRSPAAGCRGQWVTASAQLVPKSPPACYY